MTWEGGEEQVNDSIGFGNQYWEESHEEAFDGQLEQIGIFKYDEKESRKVIGSIITSVIYSNWKRKKSTSSDRK